MMPIVAEIEGIIVKEVKTGLEFGNSG